MKRLSIFLLLAACLHTRTLGVDIEPTVLQAAFNKDPEAFEFVDIPADGTPVNFDLELGKSVVKCEGSVFDGFRFRYPKEGKPRDFVWYFTVPNAWSHWYLLSRHEKPRAAFSGWLELGLIYQQHDRFNDKGRSRAVQSLQTKHTPLVPGEEYFIWFTYKKDDALWREEAACRGAAAFPEQKEPWLLADVENALALKPAPLADQVAYLNSRGGSILSDRRLFSPAYANDVVRTLGYHLRTAAQMKLGGPGFKAEPPLLECDTHPPVSVAVDLFGEPDFKETSEQRTRGTIPPLRRRRGEPEPVLAARYCYDYFSFEVEEGVEDPKILRVVAHPYNFAKLQPPPSGLSYRVLPVPPVDLDERNTYDLAVFYKDGKEVGRAYNLLKALIPPLLAPPPPRGDYPRKDRTMVYEGEGNWRFNEKYPDGKVKRLSSLKDNLLNGPFEFFHPNSNIASRGTYLNGKVEGEVTEFAEDGRKIRVTNYHLGKQEGPAREIEEQGDPMDQQPFPPGH